MAAIIERSGLSTAKHRAQKSMSTSTMQIAVSAGSLPSHCILLLYLHSMNSLVHVDSVFAADDFLRSGSCGTLSLSFIGGGCLTFFLVSFAHG